MTPDERWKQALLGIPAVYKVSRRLWSRLPGSPRCKNCTAPFAGPGSVIARAMGFKPWERNPTFCARCLPTIEKRGVGGAEIELSMLFADVRGSTPLAETMSPGEFAVVLQRFYTAATDSLLRHDAMVDSFIGDEVIGLFIPAFTGSRHAERGLAAGRDLMRALGYGTPGGGWIPVGAGIHTGTAYVGAVGAEGKVVDVKALGDSVNTTARLASSAAAGELLVSEATQSAAGLDTTGLERRVLDLKGKSEPFTVFVVRI